MNSNLILIPTKGMPETEWLQHRQNGIGSSEVGTVLLLNPYESQLELYHRKIGAAPLVKHNNQQMWFGHLHENTIATAWEYYDGSIESAMARWALGKEHKFRRCRRFNYIVKNPKYPALSGNLDRLINKGQVKIFDGDILETEGILEIKTVREWALKRWEAEVPPQYVLQIQSYLGICELTYCEMAILKDGNSLDVIPFYFNQSIFDSILDAVNPFWERVKKGRLLMNELRLAEMSGERRAIEDLKDMLDQNEPPFDPRDATARTQYLNKRYTAESYCVRGGMEQYEAARKYMQVHNSIKEYTEQKDHWGSIIKGFMKNHDEMDFGDTSLGTVTWKADKNGTRSLKMNKITA